MASTRKKQDERNLKTIRELVSYPHNKHCFDCNQRGPTYVNVTIGSFVCTKCSGMLRGLTPPHRVKSISMATFTPEEVDLLRTRGNDYCQRVWLGLYEGAKPSDRDEQAVHTLMLDKYERKRYYMEPSMALRNGYSRNEADAAAKTTPVPIKRTTTSIIPEPRPHGRATPVITNGFDKMNGAAKTDFVADFAHADIFNAANNNNGNVEAVAKQPSFANFENNPIFNSETLQESEEEFSIFKLQFTPCGPVYNHVPLFPKMNINRWSAPSNISTMNALNNAVTQQKSQASNGPPAPPEDRYAALKDLDNALKSQPAIDWNSGGSSSSLYSSPTTAGSMYSSTASPQSSSYGSPSQGQFMNLFASQEPSNNISNPFNTSGMWNASNGNQHNGINPFRASPDTFGMNGGSNYQPMLSTPINGMSWTPNPFKVANGHSNNPFL